jgi:hypothetical protein
MGVKSLALKSTLKKFFQDFLRKVVLIRGQTNVFNHIKVSQFWESLIEKFPTKSNAVRGPTPVEF